MRYDASTRSQRLEWRARRELPELLCSIPEADADASSLLGDLTVRIDELRLHHRLGDRDRHDLVAP